MLPRLHDPEQRWRGCADGDRAVLLHAGRSGVLLQGPEVGGQQPGRPGSGRHRQAAQRPVEGDHDGFGQLLRQLSPGPGRYGQGHPARGCLPHRFQLLRDSPRAEIRNDRSKALTI